MFVDSVYIGMCVREREKKNKDEKGLKMSTIFRFVEGAFSEIGFSFIFCQSFLLSFIYVIDVS